MHTEQSAQAQIHSSSEREKKTLNVLSNGLICIDVKYGLVCSNLFQKSKDGTHCNILLKFLILMHLKIYKYIMEFAWNVISVSIMSKVCDCDSRFCNLLLEGCCYSSASCLWNVDGTFTFDANLYIW